MAAPVELIQLQPDDDVISVRDRLSFVESNRVLLVWPPDDEAVLQRKLDLVLLHRAARRRAARMALITRDRVVIEHARELNISTFSTIEASRRERWKRGHSKVFTDRSHRPDSDPDHGELRGAASRLRMAPTANQLSLRRTARNLVLLGLALVILAAVVLLLPSATLTLTPAREHLDITVRVIADPAASTVDLENTLIPATFLQVEIEESAALETTGVEDSNPTLATGTVVFTNESSEALTIPAGTTVNTSTGAIVRFRTLEAVTISGQPNAIAAVAIEALPQYAGPPGNVPSFAINFIDGPLNDLLTVANPDPTSGGMIPNKRIVAASDHERLLSAVRGAIQQRALTELTAMLGQHQAIVPETIRIAETRPEWTAFSAQLGEEAAAINLTMRAVVQAVVLDERMVNQAAFAGLAQRIPTGLIVDTDTITFTRDTVETIDATGRITFLANVAGDVTSAVDSAQLQRAIAGMTLDGAIQHARTQLNLAENTTPRATVWPPFISRMPLLPDRIQVVIQEAP